MKRTTVAAALGVLAFACFASIGHAQADSAYRQRTATAKSSGAAVALSFVIPGLGQAYADEPGRGAVFMVLAAGGAVVGAYNLQTVKTCDAAGRFCSTGPRSGGAGVGGVAVSVMSWIASMLDAPGSVHRYNEKHQVRVSVARTDKSIGLEVSFSP